MAEPRNRTAMTRDAAFAELAAHFGARFSRAAADLAQHAQSESYVSAGRPEAVVWPAEVTDVVALVRVCAQYRVPMTAWGAGTSLEGHALALKGGVIVDFSRMDRVLSVQPDDMVCTVQPGVTREALNADLRATGLFFPVDPGANATLGGMASTRASGTTAVRYGTMRDNVRALEVVLADGRVIRTGTAAPKTASGYDLTGLFVGAEGTLGLITELTLRLRGHPEAVAAATCAFPDMHSAVTAVMETIQSGLPMARIEFLDAASIAACNAHAGMSLPLTPHLLVEFHGTAQSVADEAVRFGDIAAEHGCSGFDWADRPEDRARLWKMRHNAYPAILASKPGSTAIVTDVCVPISNLAEAVEETRDDIEASSIPGPILGHVGDGNFHAILLIDPASATEMADARRLAARMADRALRLGGTITGEHGIGMGKLGHMQAEHGEAWAVMGTLKRALDPMGLMNPGKLVPGPNAYKT